MAKITNHIVQAFVTGNRGALVAEKALPCKTPDEAIRRAQRQAETKTGVVAFTQAGDSETGDYDDPVVLFRAGRLPPEFGE